MSASQPAGISVLIVADPGLPSRRAHAVEQRLEAYLQEHFEPPVQTYVRVERIRMNQDSTLDVASAAAFKDDYDRVDMVLLLTEIPRHVGGTALVSETFPEENLAVISLPAVGAWATKRRLLSVFISSIDTLRKSALRGSLDEQPDWGRWQEEPGTERHRGLHGKRFSGSVRLMLGMTLANEPLKTASKLSTALAAAMATGAFGIFYNSIWQMSDSLSNSRMAVVAVIAVVSMVAWLLLSNRLWERPRRESLSRVTLLYNGSTLLTLLFCVVILYLALAVVILVAGLLVISPDYMSSVLRHPAKFHNYLDIAWLSAALGVVAGALGSSFDSNADIKDITHGQRERQRFYDDAGSAL